MEHKCKDWDCDKEKEHNHINITTMEKAKLIVQEAIIKLKMLAEDYSDKWDADEEDIEARKFIYKLINKLEEI